MDVKYIMYETVGNEKLFIKNKLYKFIGAALRNGYHAFITLIEGTSRYGQNLKKFYC